uniref:Uncharacterized protein n=2 Tax=Picea TaxID=3328 RepID=A0A101M172_PICGL|nr:hypothetical protein ABT39_MTgene3669 [Picea glauca]QHR91388.1 hypothetical protein Q903MT_gene5422 [Picea sitchensis]
MLQNYIFLIKKASYQVASPPALLLTVQVYFGLSRINLTAQSHGLLLTAQ